MDTHTSANILSVKCRCMSIIVVVIAFYLPEIFPRLYAELLISTWPHYFHELQSMSSSMTSSLIKQSIMSLSMYDESTSSHGAASATTLSQAAHNGHCGQPLHNGQTLSHDSSYGDGLDKLKDAANAITGMSSSASCIHLYWGRERKYSFPENVESSSKSSIMISRMMHW